MNFIVSRNYRDRGDHRRWLVRLSGQHPDRAKPVEKIRCYNVRFQPSEVFEEGFGCRVVAVAKNVVFTTCDDDISAFVPIVFDYDKFLMDGRKVETVAVLNLDEQMRAL